MTDYYEVLQVSRSADQAEISSAFESVLAERRSRRQKASDVHAAFAVIGDTKLRRAYDLIQFGTSATYRLEELVPDIDFEEVAREVRTASLKAVVLMSGLTAKASDVVGVVARKVQGRARGYLGTGE